MKTQANILVVDDDVDIVRVASMRLKLRGYNTFTASSGDEALRVIPDLNLDAVLLDVRMPGMTGLDVLKQLKSESATADIPVVMISASLIYKEVAMEYGAFEYMNKPYESADLIDTVERALSSTLAV